MKEQCGAAASFILRGRNIGYDISLVDSAAAAFKNCTEAEAEVSL